MATGYPKILYENRFNDATPAASTTASGYSVLNVVDWRPYTWWKPTAGTSTITVDCGSAKSADYALIYAEAGVYQAYASTDNFVSSNVLQGTITLSATGLGWVAFTSVSYRYWRILSITGTPAVAIAAIGVALEVPAYFDEGFDPRGRTAVSQYNRSIDGHALGAVVDFQEWKQTLRFPLVNGSSGWTWIRNSFEPAWNAHLMVKPFGLAWDPTGNATEVILLSSAGSFAAPHKAGGICDLTLAVSGVMA
jgi:hypothetical protein